ncbi:MAG: hypothetical protein IBX44_03885 [Sulfurospirillum sp.]|nr:hypothetical protein [Sulfurospirillum sp.]
MLSKAYLIVLVFVIFAGSFFYFSSNSSYKNSTQSRVYYFLGDYEKALYHAQIAYELDSYNKMAFTVLTQSKIAKKYENYIQEGNLYLQKIATISDKTILGDGDRFRIKMMCEVMIDSFDMLTPTALTDKNLLENAKKMQEKFKQLYKELF